MPTPSLTILTWLLVVTFDSIYTTPIAGPRDLLASSWSWAMCSRCRGAVTAVSGECGKHEFNCRKIEGSIDFQGRGFDLSVDGSPTYFPSVFHVVVGLV